MFSNREIIELTNKHDKSLFNSHISLCFCLLTQTSKNQINRISSPIWFHFMLSVFLVRVFHQLLSCINFGLILAHFFLYIFSAERASPKKKSLHRPLLISPEGHTDIPPSFLDLLSHPPFLHCFHIFVQLSYVFFFSCHFLSPFDPKSLFCK